MRLAGLGLVGLTACAPVFGLEPPVLSTSDGPTNDNPKGAPCQGDNFDDNMLDMNRWVPFTEGQVQVVERSQRLEIVLDGLNGSAYSGLDAAVPLAPGETGVQVEVVQPSRDDATETALALFVSAANQLVLGKDGTMLRAIVRSSGTNDGIAIPWPANLRFLRIERAGNQVTFSTSDGSTWQTVRTATFGFSMQNLKPELYAGHYMQAPVATIAFDNFEILTADCDPM